MAKKKTSCKRCVKKACKVPKATPDLVASEPAVEVPRPDAMLTGCSKTASRIVEDAAFWRPILAKPRWDWLAAAVAMLIFCLIATCRPAKGDVRVDVGLARGGITVDVGRDGVDVDLSMVTPRPPHSPWWIRGPHWGPQHWRHSPRHERAVPKSLKPNRNGR